MLLRVAGCGQVRAAALAPPVPPPCPAIHACRATSLDIAGLLPQLCAIISLVESALVLLAALDHPHVDLTARDRSPLSSLPASRLASAATLPSVS
ncbi:hypothetical protein VTJ04DRAFT_1416 [Mycothermus thermophilus]|uniref:uncharacterized protein n=1 Tax=Humicola insolens TaxID=85995 RepID=UPI003742930A